MWKTIDTMALQPADDKVSLVSNNTFEMREGSEIHYGIEDERERQEEKRSYGSTSLR